MTTKGDNKPVAIEEQLKIIAKGAAELIHREELQEKLENSEKDQRPLVVKLGLDPTAPDIHLGHTVVLRKIRQLQDLGHEAVIIIGDFTGRIGDPSGKSKTRPPLTEEAVLANARTYQQQMFKVVDPKKTRMEMNSRWLGELNFEGVLKLAATYTVSRMLEREDFKNRFQQERPIGIHEFFYPLMQGYDSVAIRADIELGGTDQKFNILMGRTLQKEYGQTAQAALFMPLLEGLDGQEKMSKSLGNYIGIDEAPEQMYHKTMRVPDGLLIKYFNLVTDVHPDEIEALAAGLKGGKLHPKEVKMRLARELVTLYHGAPAATAAEEGFVQVYQKGQTPEQIKGIAIGASETLPDILFRGGLASSKSQARRLVEQRGVKVNGVLVTDFHQVRLATGDVIQVGKGNFIKIE